MDSYDNWKRYFARFCASKSLVEARFQHCSEEGNAFVCRNIIFHPSLLIWSTDYDLSRRRIVEKLANACCATTGWRCTAISAAGEIPQVSTGFSSSMLVEINLGCVAELFLNVLTPEKFGITSHRYLIYFNINRFLRKTFTILFKVSRILY